MQGAPTINDIDDGVDHKSMSTKAVVALNAHPVAQEGGGSSGPSVPPRSRLHWMNARTLYMLNTWAGSARFQAVAMMALGLVHTVVFGVVYALVFPNSEVLLGIEGDETFDHHSVAVSDKDWNYLPRDIGLKFIPEGIWNSWMWMCDPGHQENAKGLPERILAVYISIFGILYFSCIVGLIVEAVQDYMDALRKGRTAVVEENHVVMLGWTDKSLLFIKEVINANESEGGGVVCVLAEEEKEVLDATIAHHFQGQMKGTKVVVRNGSRLNTPDLAKLSLDTCKAVVVLSDPDAEPNKVGGSFLPWGDDSNGKVAKKEGQTNQWVCRSLQECKLTKRLLFVVDRCRILSVDADSEVMQVVLAMSGLDRKGHVVAEVRDVDNEKLVKMIDGDKGGEIETVVSHDIIGRLMLMCVRYPGLAAVYDAVLGFEGSEFYMENWPELNGVPFDDLQRRFPDAIPIGVKTDAGLVLNPPVDYTMQADDLLVVFADDNDTYKPMPPAEIAINRSQDAGTPNAPREPEMLLFCGWRRDLRDMIMLLDSMVVKGSELHILCTLSIKERAKQFEDGGMDVESLTNLTIRHLVGNPAIQRYLERVPIKQYSSVLILSDQSSETNIMQSDSACLATLMLIRAIQTREGAANDELPELSKQPSQSRSAAATSGETAEVPGGTTGKGSAVEDLPVVCEILDPRTQATIQANMNFACMSDFLQSNDMVGKILAMVSEEILVKAILDELLEANRCQLQVLPSDTCVLPEEELSFMELSMRARMMRNTLVGYFQVEKDQGAVHPIINPTDKTTRKTWKHTVLIVISTSEGIKSVSGNQPQEKRSRRRRVSKMQVFEHPSPHVSDHRVRRTSDGTTQESPRSHASHVSSLACDNKAVLAPGSSISKGEEHPTAHGSSIQAQNEFLLDSLNDAMQENKRQREHIDRMEQDYKKLELRMRSMTDRMLEQMTVSQKSATATPTRLRSSSLKREGTGL